MWILNHCRILKAVEVVNIIKFYSYAYSIRTFCYTYVYTVKTHTTHTQRHTYVHAHIQYGMHIPALISVNACINIVVQELAYRILLFQLQKHKFQRHRQKRICTPIYSPRILITSQ